MFDWATGKVFPTTFPHVLKDGHSGTGNFDGHDGRDVFRLVLVNLRLTKLDKDPRHQHGFMVDTASSCKPEGHPIKLSVKVLWRIQHKQGKSMSREQLSILEKVAGFRVRRQGNPAHKWAN